jgi:hypothetical protein
VKHGSQEQDSICFSGQLEKGVLLSIVIHQGNYPLDVGRLTSHAAQVTIHSRS